ncbi:uncharacterized protein TNCT_483811 [Trichonephila clavata]|uniref:Uncharacterized protein n=1 Tax=Trichonephila clavata TaxID=2740835 RepID=A0A8X6M3A1_TRICU|nr:uncharacterized protein TNCT_483811 [Trichonephila clavata]
MLIIPKTGTYYPDLSSNVDNLRINLWQRLNRPTSDKRGFWTLKCCDQNVDSNGFTENDNVWRVLNDLFEETPEIFQFRPSQWGSCNGYAMLKCYTPNDSDEYHILKIVNIIREKIDFPFQIRYFSKITKWKYAPIYLHTPNGEFYKRENKAWKYADL